MCIMTKIGRLLVHDWLSEVSLFVLKAEPESGVENVTAEH